MCWWEWEYEFREGNDALDWWRSLQSCSGLIILRFHLNSLTTQFIIPWLTSSKIILRCQGIFPSSAKGTFNGFILSYIHCWRIFCALEDFQYHILQVMNCQYQKLWGVNKHTSFIGCLHLPDNVSFLYSYVIQ